MFEILILSQTDTNAIRFRMQNYESTMRAYGRQNRNLADLLLEVVLVRDAEYFCGKLY